MNFNKKRVGAIALAAAIAVSTLSIGFASWKTDITAGGNVTADGKWKVVVTEASMNLSNGTTAAETTYKLLRTNEKSDDTVIADIAASDWVDDESLVGTQSDEAMKNTTNIYAIDKTKFDVSDVKKLDRTKVAADVTTVNLSEHLNKYYRNAHGFLDDETSRDRWAAMVVDGLFRDTTALLKELYPDTYQNYVLARLFIMPEVFPDATFKIGEFSEVPVEAEATISEDATSVTYDEVVFGLPGAWAEYSMTVENQGTVNANLADAEIKLETKSEQLVLDAPTLDDEVLAPGEKCTITFVVQVPETVDDDLDAAGTLTVKLPYSQDTVDEAPKSGHTHETN